MKQNMQKFFLFAFNWWAVLLALAVCLPIGFCAGYEVKQPSLSMVSTKALLTLVDKIENQIAVAETRGSGASEDALAKLQPIQADLEAIKAVAGKPPGPNRAEIVSTLNVALDDVDTLKAAAFVRESKFGELYTCVTH